MGLVLTDSLLIVCRCCLGREGEAAGVGSGPHMELCCTASEQRERGEKKLYLLSLFCPYPYRWNSAADIQSGVGSSLWLVFSIQTLTGTVRGLSPMWF